MSLLEAGVLADVVSGLIATQVIPEVVPEDGEEGVVDLHHAEAGLKILKETGIDLYPKERKIFMGKERISI